MATMGVHRGVVKPPERRKIARQHLETARDAVRMAAMHLEDIKSYDAKAQASDCHAIAARVGDLMRSVV